MRIIIEADPGLIGKASAKSAWSYIRALFPFLDIEIVQRNVSRETLTSTRPDLIAGPRRREAVDPSRRKP